MKNYVVLLGTGTPNAEPFAAGPCTAVVVEDHAYLVDFGPGVVRQASRAYFEKGIDALRPDRLTVAFCTHLHTDHTVGLSDLIFTPWVLERKEPLKLFGPSGLKHMSERLLDAYRVDIDFRKNGPEKANANGYRCVVQEIEEGVVYTDERVQVEAFRVCHGSLECYSYRFTTKDGKVIFISGDTAPLPLVATEGKGCALLLHECAYTAGLEEREEKWRNYHRQVHTTSVDLGRLAQQARPDLLVTYHRIYHMDLYAHQKDLMEEVKKRCAAILEEIGSVYDGTVVNGEDLDVFEF